MLASLEIENGQRVNFLLLVVKVRVIEKFWVLCIAIHVTHRIATHCAASESKLKLD